MPFMDCIPQEIVIKVLQCCDFLTVLRFSLTCRAYRELVTCSSLLQLHIELQANGYQLSDQGYRRSREGAAARLLDEFRRFRDGWLYMKIRKPLRLEPVDADMRLYELRQGYYAAALSSTYALPGIVKLTGLHDSSSSRLLSLGIQFSEFQIDPSQDLMVLVAIEAPISPVSSIHIRSVYTGGPHTSALHPDWTIHLPFHMERRSSGIFVEVMDELLVIKYVSYEKEVSNILIWNWKNGALLNRIECRGVSCSFGFLTCDSLILFQSTDTPAVNLLVYEHIRSSCHQTQLHPHCNVSECPVMIPSAVFGFPELPVNAIAYLLMRSEPVPTLYSSGPSMFLPLPVSRVIQLSMTVIRNVGHDRGLTQYQIFLSKERLLNYHVPRDTTRPDSPTSTVRIPWEVWGERTTRWFGTMSAISPWICRTYGTRFIQAHPFGDDDENDQPLEYLSILEFHQPTVRRFSSLGCDKHLSMWTSKEARKHVDLNSSDEDMEYVTNTLLSKHRDIGPQDHPVFVDTIDEDVPSYTPFNGKSLVTRLPYRIVTRRRPVPKHSGWMMDNNLIIGMPTWQGDDLENIQNEHMNIFTPMA